MSHQGQQGWFPECIVCHLGNVGPVICLDPTCHEKYGRPEGLTNSLDHYENLCRDEKLINEDGHWWKCCQLCDRRLLSDPGAFGSFAICVECFHKFASRGERAPTAPWQVR